MEKDLKKINKMSMKDVWKHYNKNIKKRSHTKINIENEEEKTNFM